MTKKNQETDLLTAEMAAKYLGISKVTFYKRKEERDIKTSFHVGGHGYYRKCDVEVLRESK